MGSAATPPLLNAPPLAPFPLIPRHAAEPRGYRQHTALPPLRRVRSVSNAKAFELTGCLAMRRQRLYNSSEKVKFWINELYMGSKCQWYSSSLSSSSSSCLGEGRDSGELLPLQQFQRGPAPVLTWLARPPSPALLTAATLSVPPTIVVAPLSVVALGHSHACATNGSLGRRLRSAGRKMSNELTHVLIY